MNNIQTEIKLCLNGRVNRYIVRKQNGFPEYIRKPAQHIG